VSCQKKCAALPLMADESCKAPLSAKRSVGARNLRSHHRRCRQLRCVLALVSAFIQQIRTLTLLHPTTPSHILGLSRHRCLDSLSPVLRRDLGQE
jgi:hypothetical protein